MELKDYLIREGLSEAQFLKKLGYSKFFLRGCRTAGRNPGKKFWVTVELLTNGDVKECEQVTKIFAKDICRYCYGTGKKQTRSGHKKTKVRAAVSQDSAPTGQA